jgi:cytochrome c biogenesis factor
MPAYTKNYEITLKTAVNPLQIWVWIGSFIMVLGGILAILPGGIRGKKA